MGAQGFVIRAFDPCRDTTAAIRCYESGFGATIGPIFDYSDPAAIEDLLMTDYRTSDYCIVAEADGEARGVLFGSLPSSKLKSLRQELMFAAMLFRRLVWRRSEMRPFARAVLWHSTTREYLYYLHTPRGRAAEVGSLTSEEGWRKGIGRALMDAFVQEARSRGFRRVYLGTDTELSWGFYEKYGFKRVAAWPNHAYDYTLPDKDVTAFIYSLEI